MAKNATNNLSEVMIRNDGKTQLKDEASNQSMLGKRPRQVSGEEESTMLLSKVEETPVSASA
jgi:hypothetical protein